MTRSKFDLRKVKAGDRLSQGFLNALAESVMGGIVPSNPGGFEGAGPASQRILWKDGTYWVRALSHAELPAYSVVKVTTGDIQEDGLVFEVDVVDEATAGTVYATNGEYPIMQNVECWVALLNPHRPFKIRVTPGADLDFSDTEAEPQDDGTLAVGTNVGLKLVSVVVNDEAFVTFRPVGESMWIIRFAIAAMLPDTRSAIAEIRAVPPGFNRYDAPGQILSGVVTICDPHGCHFNETLGGLLGREGWAAYMQPYQSAGCQEDIAEEYMVPQWEVFNLCCPTTPCDIEE